ncbi:imidazole glycerol phosphate synthase, glutamine amidotransferase subunit [Halovivax ruber XH-70]|uniref:Imidazole glycerol phosphate synthase subunit HisH n=1 Tax=Halovivax ruber (strain DSM 18193 / JCM 13892 / XH-70) TaxID=797302 RepID=L0IHA3_HALRX|nr:imidazole glycerol phosphate synthase subunit HisH [Halovivax ruber]AGB17626.1 imidazole glycerol phosphate synthase, glutamine amidotransferase subunit [Halovivax ruber XH-70]
MSEQAGRSSPETVDATVAVVDYGLGNLHSVTRGLERAGASVEITADPERFHAADGVVLPGVGAFREGVENADPLREDLLAVADSDTPLFGICLGMQMLLTDSEEGSAGESAVSGLDLIPGTNVRFDEGQKVPHMGWNDLSVERDHPLVSGVAPSGADGNGSSNEQDTSAHDTEADDCSVDGEYAYFVHSYYAVPDDESAVVATTGYGTRFPAVIADESGTVFGTQFHPEKSGETGLQILRNFVSLCTA